ncbi:MAG: T9SS type A sorting domain-containing protein [Candidatus Latescibacteria bacterium]|nr:T9SS type A sorting domain-containing protein [Candidatus Latescibacterota bacterium]
MQTIRERLIEEPYASWFERLLNETDSIVQSDISWDSPEVPEETKAYYAKLLAFAYAFSDISNINRTAYGTEAASSLYYIPSGDYPSYFSSDLTISEGVLFWAEAYDILKGAAFDFDIEGLENEETTIRSNFRKLRDYMARDWTLFGQGIANDFPSVIYLNTSYTDNHHLKLYASLTVLALTIANEDGFSGDFETGFTRLTDVLNNLTITGDNGEPAGGWGEGPGYFQYSLQQLLPALIALKNKEILDLHETSQELQQTYLWLPRIVMPDGPTPPYDDNEAVNFNVSGLLYSLIPTVPERDMLLWMWNNTDRAMNNAYLPEYIARFDDTPPVYAGPVEQGWKSTGFYPESGFARFRNSWDNDAVYLLLLSEHGEARINGLAHEHPDPNSFILHAYGEMLILDSGYGGFSEHDLTRYARNHNLILINGQGPSGAAKGGLGIWEANGSDANLLEYFTSSSIDYALSETIYQNTDFKRHIMFPGHRCFFMYDSLISGSEVTYSLLLHGNGGGTSGGDFSLQQNGALWEQGEAALRAYTVGSNSPLLYETSEMEHAVYQRTPMLSHTVLSVSQTASTAKYLTLLYPYRMDSSIPNIAEATVTNGTGIYIADSDTVEYGCIKLEQENMVLNTGFGEYSSDGDFLYAKVEDENFLHNFFFISGTTLISAQDTLLWASHPINISLDYSLPLRIEGYIQSAQETIITLFDAASQRVVFNDIEIPFGSDDNAATFTISGEGELVIELKETVLQLDPPGSVIIEDVPNDNGHRLSLTWTPSPSEVDGLVDWYRIFRSRSSVLTEPVPLSRFSSIDSLNAWDAHYTILIDSVAAGITQYIDQSIFYNGVPYYYWIQAARTAGESEKIAAGILAGYETTPLPFNIQPPYPNPFNAETTIHYELPNDCKVELVIYDILGRKVAVLENEHKHAGAHTTVWNGTNNEDISVVSGVYIFRLKADAITAHGKVLLVR